MWRKEPMALEKAKQTSSAGALVPTGHYRDKCSERDRIKQVFQTQGIHKQPTRNAQEMWHLKGIKFHFSISAINHVYHL